MKKTTYESLIRNFSAYEQKLQDNLRTTEVPLRHLKAVITAEKDGTEKKFAASSKTVLNDSSFFPGYSLPDMADIYNLHELFGSEENPDGWKITNIEINPDDMKLLTIASTLKPFDEMVQQVNESYNKAIEDLFLALTAGKGITGNKESITRDTNDFIKQIMECYKDSNNFCKPLYYIDDNYCQIPCWISSKCNQENCVYKSLVMSADNPTT